jgi:peptide deformylase
VAKLKIYTFPDKVLATRALPISRVEKSYYKTADDMLETMYEAPGVGLAANQVGILERIIVLDTEYSHEEPMADMELGETPSGIVVNKKPIIMINPEIVYQEGKIVWCEGCLSVPEYQADVERAEKIKVKYQDIDGVTRTLDAEGLQAVCVQHEIDHLNGKLFIERLSQAKKDTVKKKLIRMRKEEEDSDSGDDHE